MEFLAVILSIKVEYTEGDMAVAINDLVLKEIVPHAITVSYRSPLL